MDIRPSDIRNLRTRVPADWVELLSGGFRPGVPFRGLLVRRDYVLGDICPFLTATVVPVPYVAGWYTPAICALPTNMCSDNPSCYSGRARCTTNTCTTRPHPRWSIANTGAQLSAVCNACSLNKSSAVTEMGDRGHNRYGPKRGGGCCAPFAERWEPV